MLAVGPNKLLLAASVGDHQEMQRLIEGEGLSLCHVYPRGVTALHEACEAGHTDAAKLLVDNGADVDKQVHIIIYIDTCTYVHTYYIYDCTIL